MTQIIEAVENSPLIQVPQNTPQIKQNVLSLKQFVVMQQLWLTLSRQSYFYYDKQWICFSIILETIYSILVFI
jgi:hypothetical protein